MKDIYGLIGLGLFDSSDLQSSLANRLQAQKGLNGSILFKLTWKERATPSGRLICALRASALPISVNGCILSPWPSPITNDSKNSTHCYSGGDHQKVVLKLPGVARLAIWPTPHGAGLAKRQSQHCDFRPKLAPSERNSSCGFLGRRRMACLP